jgi:hypothetical protein
MKWVMAITGDRDNVVIPIAAAPEESAHHLDSSRLKRTTFSFPLFPQTPGIGRVPLPRVWFWTSTSMCAVETITI